MHRRATTESLPGRCAADARRMSVDIDATRVHTRGGRGKARSPAEQLLSLMHHLSARTGPASLLPVAGRPPVDEQGSSSAALRPRRPPRAPLGSSARLARQQLPRPARNRRTRPAMGSGRMSARARRTRRHLRCRPALALSRMIVINTQRPWKIQGEQIERPLPQNRSLRPRARNPCSSRAAPCSIQTRRPVRRSLRKPDSAVIRAHAGPCLGADGKRRSKARKGWNS